MRIFVTGATRFVGSALVPELLRAGHQVLGLTRSEAGAETLRKAGAEARYGDLEDPKSLREGAAGSDAVIHLAFDHDFTNFQKNCEDDRIAIEAIGEALSGSQRPFVVTSPTGIAENINGRPSTEESPTSSWNPRASSETAVKGLTARGLNASVVRLPQVHDTHLQGLVTYLAAVAREKQLSAYLGDGLNRWPAAHVSDVARLYRLAIEKAEPGAIHHAVDEVGVCLHEIAEAVGRGLKVPVVSISPEKAQPHFGWLAVFAGLDMPSSGELTRERLGWMPNGPGLISDLDGMDYTKV